MTEEAEVGPLATMRRRRADWTGTGSLVAPPREPLVMGLAFRNIIEGVRIFEGWRTRVGTVDEDEAIRVAIVLGISRRNPAHYAVTIGRTIGGDRFPPGGQFISLTRFQRMEPAPSAPRSDVGTRR